MESRGMRDHTNLMTKVVEHRTALQQVQHHVIKIEEKMTDTDKALNRKLDLIAYQVDESQQSLLSLRAIGVQIFELLRTFPLELRESLRSILQSNWHMYRILLQIQSNLFRAPTGILDSNIKFEDGLGDRRELPYDIFRHWEVRALIPFVTR